MSSTQHLTHVTDESEERENQRHQWSLGLHRGSDRDDEFEAKLSEVLLLELLKEDCNVELDFKPILKLVHDIHHESTKSGTIVKLCHQRVATRKSQVELIMIGCTYVGFCLLLLQLIHVFVHAWRRVEKTMLTSKRR